MDWNNQKFLTMVYLFALSFLCGCTTVENLVCRQQQESFDALIEEGREVLLEMETYKGRGREDVRERFGEPTGIMFPGWFEGVKYEERWFYKYDKGDPVLFPHEHVMNFYLNSGVIVAVEAI